MTGRRRRHRDRTRRNRKVIADISQRVVRTQVQRALANGVVTDIFTGRTIKRAVESVAEGQRTARDGVGIGPISGITCTIRISKRIHLRAVTSRTCPHRHHWGQCIAANIRNNGWCGYYRIGRTTYG